MNTVCFIGVFQFLGTYAVSGDPWALGVFVNGVIYHGGCRLWKWPDIVFNCAAITYKVLYAPNLFVTRVCALIACLVYLMNMRGSNIVHAVGVQYILNISMIHVHSQAAIPPCLLLGTVIAGIINGAPRLATGCVEASRGTYTEASFAKPPPTGEGHPRERSRRSYYVSTTDRARHCTGFSEAARPFLRGTASRLSGQGKGHGRSRSW